MPFINLLVPLNVASLFLYWVYFFASYYLSAETILNTSSVSSSYSVTALRLVALAGCLISLAGLWRKISAYSGIIVYLLAVWSININYTLLQLHYSYLAICLLHYIIFKEDPLALSGKWGKWTIDSRYLMGFLFNLTFTISGFSKCFYSPWLDGSAFRFLVSRPYQLSLSLDLKSLDLTVLAALSYVVLLIEIMSLPLFLFRKTRLIGWIINVIFHLFIFSFMPDIRNISSALLISFIYIFDRKLYTPAAETSLTSRCEPQSPLPDYAEAERTS